ncbi:MAG: Ig-like domain-containing protein [Flavobacteriaceae bacterium]|nr:Ig-like domain-containing protein [Flavobacteriaceae bacterium]
MKFRFLYLIYGAIILLIFDSCARRGRPTGGEKDKDAPILISAEPDHKSTNFYTKKIRINFNEYIKLKDINKQLVISPPMENQPIITPVGSASKFINIKILDTLKENTTYTFNFGNSVEDNNEGNPLEQFKYVFSTGSYIDSLSISGTVADAFNKKADKDISILLYEVTENYTDSIIYNERPSYVANSLDSIGFELTNLKSGKYLMIALNDANNNYKFNPKIDKIGFLPDFITLPTDSAYKITLFKEELPFKLMRPSEIKKGHIYFGYEGNPKGISIDPLLQQTEDFKSTVVFEKELDSVSYWFTPIEADSIQFKVNHKSFIDTVTVKLRSKEIDSLIVNNESRGTLNLRDTFAISTNIPIHKINKSKIKIIDKDSVNVNFTTSLDASKMKLKLNFEKKYNNRYKFNLLPDAIEDLFGNVNDTLNFNTSTKHPDDYGIINLSLQNVENFPIILELIDEDYNLINRIYATENQIFKFKNLDPKNYLFRVIYDTNKNRKWDTGNFLNRIKPEKIIYLKKPIELRANWELNEDFNLK